MLNTSLQTWLRCPPSWRILQIAAGSPLLPAHITSANLTLLLLTEKRVFKLCSKGRLLCLTNSLRYPPHNSHNASSCHIIWNAKDRITFNYKQLALLQEIFYIEYLSPCVMWYVFDVDVPDFKMLVFKCYSASVQLPSYKWWSTLLMPSNFSSLWLHFIQATIATYCGRNVEY